MEVVRRRDALDSKNKLLRYRLCNDGRVEKLGDVDGDVKAELATQQEEEMATLLVCPMCQLGFQKVEDA